MGLHLLICVGITVFAFAQTCTEAYTSHAKEHMFLADALLREVADRMNRQFLEPNYIDFVQPNSQRLPGRSKDADAERDSEALALGVNDPEALLDYEAMAEEGPHPATRDGEYLQHSSLWGHQYLSGGAGEGKQRLRPDGAIQNQKQVKTDAGLPAYCNPPNPCPVGYTTDDGCLENFENTAAFSREYQAAQDCMCDAEHMFDCSASNGGGGGGGGGGSGSSASGREATPATTNGGSSSAEEHNELLDAEADIEKLVREYQVPDQHKTLVAKKFHTKKSVNPYLEGERLPVAAKKGNHVRF